MYTTFICSCRVKKEYREILGELFDENSDKEWADFIEQMPFIENFAKLPRAGFIPLGMMTAYNWDKFAEESFNHFNKMVGSWNFCCDLKNYDSEIETFIYEVLPHLCSIVYFCAYWYEESCYPTIVFTDDVMFKEKLDLTTATRFITAKQVENYEEEV